MTTKVDSRPQYVPLPPAAAELIRLKIVCPAYACRYTVIARLTSAQPAATTPPISNSRKLSAASTNRVTH
jgi:hypothetical protein